MTTKTDVAHLAGVTDGKVCIGVYRRLNQASGNYSYYPVVRSLSVRPALAKFLRRATKLGGVRVTPAQHIDGFVHVWEVLSYGDIKEFLNPLLPYLKLKSKEAKLMLDFINVCEDENLTTPQRHRRQEQFYWKSKTLKSRARKTHG